MVGKRQRSAISRKSVWEVSRDVAFIPQLHAHHMSISRAAEQERNECLDSFEGAGNGNPSTGEQEGRKAIELIWLTLSKPHVGGAPSKSRFYH